MQTLHIRNFRARYRLPARAHDERRRLDAALQTALGEVLEDELRRLGFEEREEVCIRDVFAPVRLRLSATEGALAREWGRALAAAIGRAAEGGHAVGVVRYASRFQALIDMCVGVARDDLERVWAWRQIGLWNAGGHATRQEALNEVIAALFAEPEAVVPALSTLAADGTLARLVPRLVLEHWRALAEAALEAAGVPLASELLNQSVTPSSKQAATTQADWSEPAHVNLPALLKEALLKEAGRIVSGSRIARALASTVGQLQSPRAQSERAVAILVILESNPTALSREGAEAHALVDSVVLALKHVEADLSPERARERQASGRGPGGERAQVDEEFGHTVEDELTVVRSGVARAAEASRVGELPDALASEAWRQESLIEAEVRAEAFGEERPLPFVRRSAFTRFGGLLFLLGVLEDLGLPEEISLDVALRGRALRWTLHRLARALAPGAAEDDAAVLAFAGLVPDAAPPSAVEDEPSVTEACAVEAYAARVVEALRERLASWRDETTAALLEFVCLRRAEVVADPGWFEVRLSLEEISTELRCAGLDLDPGYVRWLGVVVKFVYE